MLSRRIDSKPPEAWNMSNIKMEELDTNEDGIMEKYPIYVHSKAQRIPRPRDPQLVDPQPGCFGNGPGPMKVFALYKKLVLNRFISKVTGSRLTLNTSSFVTYAQIYELSLIVSKDTRKGMVKMDIDLGVLPVPLLEIDCAAPGLCFPTFGGIFVNPTSRYLQSQKP